MADIGICGRTTNKWQIAQPLSDADPSACDSPSLGLPERQSGRASWTHRKQICEIRGREELVEVTKYALGYRITCLNHGHFAMALSTISSALKVQHFKSVDPLPKGSGDFNLAALTSILCGH